MMSTRRVGGLQEPSARLFAVAKLGCPVGGRSQAREAAICSAVVELLNENSYESVTMDAVAGRAKASKATIYRRWANKENLVIAALNRALITGAMPLQDTGSLRNDLLTGMSDRFGNATLSVAYQAALKTLMYARSTDPELARVMNDCLQAAQLADLQTVLNRAQFRGEVDGPVDVRLVYDVLQAQICARAGASPGLDSGYLQHIVDDVLIPVIVHAGSRTVQVG